MTLSPTERADKVLEVLCDPDDQDDKRRGRPDLDLLPPGSLVLTAAEAETVRQALYIGPIPDAAHERDQLDAAHDLLSPALIPEGVLVAVADTDVGVVGD